MSSNFVNIMIMCNPNYSLKHIHGTTHKKIFKQNYSYVDQFITLYHSIRTNWKFPYRINLVHCIDFNNYDLDRLKKLNIDIIRTRSDLPLLKNNCRARCYRVQTKIKGTHRLILDTDMIALKQPKLDFNCDIQVGYEGKCILGLDVVEYLCYKFRFKKPRGKFNQNPFIEYYLRNDTNQFPYFNNGALLIKDSLCDSFFVKLKQIQALNFNRSWNDFKRKGNYKKKYLLHFGPQLCIGILIYNFTKNWKLFPKGFNYLGKTLSVARFGLHNVSLYHYLGNNGQKEAEKYLRKYFLKN